MFFFLSLSLSSCMSMTFPTYLIPSHPFSLSLSSILSFINSLSHQFSLSSTLSLSLIDSGFAIRAFISLDKRTNGVLYLTMKYSRKDTMKARVIARERAERERAKRERGRERAGEEMSCFWIAWACRMISS